MSAVSLVSSNPTISPRSTAERSISGVTTSSRSPLLLADEPTGSVDSHTAGVIIDLFRGLAQRNGVTVVTVSHDANIAQHVDRTVTIHDGRTSFERVCRVANGVVLGHDEYVIVDRGGRMQLPAELLQRLRISGRARAPGGESHRDLAGE